MPGPTGRGGPIAAPEQGGRGRSRPGRARAAGAQLGVRAGLGRGPRPARAAAPSRGSAPRSACGRPPGPRRAPRRGTRRGGRSGRAPGPTAAPGGSNGRLADAARARVAVEAPRAGVAGTDEERPREAALAIARATADRPSSSGWRSAFERRRREGVRPRRGTAPRGGRGSPLRAGGTRPPPTRPGRDRVVRAPGTAATAPAGSRVEQPATEWIRVTSIASSSVSGGRIAGSRRASIVLPALGRADHQQGVAAGGRHLERPPRGPLAADLGHVGAAGAACARAARRRRRWTTTIRAARQEVHRRPQRRRPQHLDPRHERGLGRVGRAARRGAASRSGRRARPSRGRPGTGRREPSSASSPTAPTPRSAAAGSWPDAVRIARAIGRSYWGPALRRSAGARLATMRRAGTANAWLASPSARARAPPAPPRRAGPRPRRPAGRRGGPPPPGPWRSRGRGRRGRRGWRPRTDGAAGAHDPTPNRDDGVP